MPNLPIFLMFIMLVTSCGTEDENKGESTTNFDKIKLAYEQADYYINDLSQLNVIPNKTGPNIIVALPNSIISVEEQIDIRDSAITIIGGPDTVLVSLTKGALFNLVPGVHDIKLSNFTVQL